MPSFTRFYMRSNCPISRTLDLLGDKWTLLIIRDLMIIGKKQYGEFLTSPEKISTNILAERLKRLEVAGIIEKRVYQNNPPRYEYLLSPKGNDLRPLIREISKWGLENLEGTEIPSFLTRNTD
ncbi:winged helix-turn-helix transcriptional regulator [Kiloniella antarctica]|uniref:Winged helix-turn-helix transcriptional regulator n=1 Tax=Kiloniella antarctica TaxID=1550907 RepID=A0ABW5BFV7_9PROT